MENNAAYERKVNLSLVLDSKDMMELERIAVDSDSDSALRFLLERVVKPARNIVASR